MKRICLDLFISYEVLEDYVNSLRLLMNSNYEPALCLNKGLP